MLRYRYLGILSPTDSFADRLQCSCAEGRTKHRRSRNLPQERVVSPTTATLSPGYFDSVIDKPERQDMQYSNCSHESAHIFISIRGCIDCVEVQPEPEPAGDLLRRQYGCFDGKKPVSRLFLDRRD